MCEATYVPGDKTVLLRESAREGGSEREGEGKGGERESERRRGGRFIQGKTSEREV